MGPETSTDDFVREHAAWVRGIAVGVARELRMTHAIDDLLGYGYQGLLEARAGYDPKGGTPFQGFAYYRVRGAILNGSHRVRGITRRALASALQAIDTRNEDRAGAIAAVAPEHRVEVALVELDGVVSALADSHALAMLAEDEQGGEEQVIAQLDRERIRAAVARLPERERTVLEGVYFEDAPLDDIGAKLKLSRSGTSRLHTRALALLRERLS